MGLYCSLEMKKIFASSQVVNGRLVKYIDPDKPTEDYVSRFKWSNVQVGAVLLLVEDEQLPADVIVLATRFVFFFF